VDLDPVTIGGIQGVAFCARRDEKKDPIPLWKEVREDKKPTPWDYWKFVPQDRDRPSRLKIEQEQFYLLRSKQKISVPPGVAVYCRASDETIGEMRIHYAGFAHPFFGKERPDGQLGTPLIFEVRGHQINVSLAHKERMANLNFYRMSEDCEKPPLQNGSEDPYNTQNLQLSKFFRNWPKPPEKLRRTSDDGIVEPA
jgi:deoxycytidine triphosphate deaminase